MGEPRVAPIVQSTTYVYDSTDAVADVFDDPTLGLIYSRFANPTTDVVEKKVAAMEGGVGAMATSSGQAASLLSILNLCSAGDSFISTPSIYGDHQPLRVHAEKAGHRVHLRGSGSLGRRNSGGLQARHQGGVRGNPGQPGSDGFRHCHDRPQNGVPLIVDNTPVTPVPLPSHRMGRTWWSTLLSKYMDGHAPAGRRA